MATKENLPGLFARVANFVRSPLTARNAVDELAQTPSAENSATAIKRLLARKAHNDAVRKREFAQLRNLRQSAGGAITKLIEPEKTTTQSTGFSLMEERTSTLKKIDEIEAQMSKQWWKTRQDSVEKTTVQPKSLSKVMPEMHDTFAPTLLSESGVFDAASISATFVDESRYQNKPPVSIGKLSEDHNKDSQFKLTGDSAISMTKLVSIELGEVLSDPVLEDAAIRFANSDDAGTEAVLHEAMHAKEMQSDALEAWAWALFDLYRGTGQQQSFDHFALEYAKRLDQSAPVWFSTRERLGVGFDVVTQAVAPPQSLGSWACPAELDLLSVNLLMSILNSGREAVQLDWHALEVIPLNALLPLTKVFSLCCDKPLVLHLQGERVLGELLSAQTPVGNNQIEPVWWRLRLDLLRILDLQADFELVAMDYCITYEVSPPPWVPAKSQRLTLEDTAKEPENKHDLPPITINQESDSTIALSGELIGNTSELLQRLEMCQNSSDKFLVNCGHVIRVDFAAAGSILNWVTDCYLLGKQVEFVQVPRLVGVFFNLVGINEYAKINFRSN